MTLTAQQPDNNVIRCTVQALAAILGGTQSLHVNSRDEALALPTEESVQLSLRTQQILSSESGVADVVDPLGGSYYVEHLTNKLEEEAFAYINRIDQLGGALSALEQGYQMKEISDAAYKHQRDVEEHKRTIVGVNSFITHQPPVDNILRIDPQQTQAQLDRLREVRAKRDASQAKKALSELQELVNSEENTVPGILQCVEAYCTTGEIADTLRSVFGEQEHQAGL